MMLLVLLLLLLLLLLQLLQVAYHTHGLAARATFHLCCHQSCVAAIPNCQQLAVCATLEDNAPVHHSDGVCLMLLVLLLLLQLLLLQLLRVAYHAHTLAASATLHLCCHQPCITATRNRQQLTVRAACCCCVSHITS
jgi:hypothetical protein